ncbi:MAG: tetratricopeptide repeat protein [Bacteroidota bacterium]
MSNLAIAYGKMGEIFMRKMVYDSALSYFHANASIMDSLLTKLPKEPVYLDDMTSAWVALGDAFNTIGRTDSSLFYFRKGLATATSLHKLFPQSIDFQDELALTYERMGDLKWKMGQLDSALYFFKADLSLSQILHQEYPANIRFQNLLANALQKSGEIHSIQGHADSALVYAYQDYKLCKKIVQKTPQNLTFQFDLAGSAGTLGRFFLDDFNLDSASKYFIEDYAIMESLYDSFPDHAVVVEGLVNSANNLGIVATYQEDNARAIAYHKKAFRLCSNLAARNPSVLTHKASISVSASYIGNIFAVNGTYDSAIYYYSFIKVYSQELASLDSTNITYHFHYAASLQLIGDVYYQTQDYEQAKDIYKEGIGAFMTLRRLSPLTLEYARGLFIVQQNLGKTFARLGVLDSASHYLRIAQKTILSLSEAFPENKELTSSVVASLYDIHEYYGLQEQDFEQARQYLDEAEKVQAQLAEAVPDYMAYQQDLAFLREKQQQLAFPSIYLLLTKITYEADTLTMYGLFAQLADSLKKEIAHYPHGKEKLTDVLNEKAWLGMFLGKLKESEVDLLEVLAMNADQDAARARLALVHLALGQYKRAKEICQTHMDEPFGDHEQDLLFKEVCLKDLDALERAGAIPPKRKKDVAKIRKLLGP